MRQLNVNKNELYKNELLRISKEKPLTAENIVSEAEDESNPLHQHFDWDDTSASHKYRLHQARELVNIIIEEPEGDDEPTTYSFEIIKTNGDREYKYIYDIFDNKEWKQQIIQQALRYLKSWRTKYSIYSEFGEVGKAIEKIEKKFEVKKKHGTKTRKRTVATVSA